MLRLALLSVACTALHAQAQSADPWLEMTRPGTVVLVRHGSAPGIGDPPGFRLGDCPTQRNLSEEGRAQARRLGDLFRANMVSVGIVLSSRWCRTHETARLAFGDGMVRDDPAFDSFFGEAGPQRDAQITRARQVLADWRGPGVLVVVTHQVNIQALVDIGASSAEGVVARRGPDGRWRVVAAIQP